MRSRVDLKKRKKVKKLTAPKGKIYIQSTFNNTIVSVTDEKGEVVAWGSGGTLGFKGTKKSTPYAAGVVARNVIAKVEEMGLKSVELFVKGIGPGRDQAVRALQNSNIEVRLISDKKM